MQRSSVPVALEAQQARMIALPSQRALGARYRVGAPRHQLAALRHQPQQQAPQLASAGGSAGRRCRLHCAASSSDVSAPEAAAPSSVDAVAERPDVPTAHSAAEQHEGDSAHAADAQQRDEAVRRDGFHREHRNGGRGRGGNMHRSGNQQRDAYRQRHSAPGPGGLRLGQVVVGTVVWSNEHGAKVELAESGVKGYMPSKEGPLPIESPTEAIAAPEPVQGPCLPQGLTRQFVVVKNNNDRGPLLSARQLDWDLLWRRAKQLFEASMQERENVSVTVVDANAGGVLACCEGLPQVFVPVSQLEREEEGEWWSEQELREQFRGKRLEVAINKIERNRKVVGSCLQATENKAVRQIKVGALVWGTIRRVEAFGAFVGIDNTHISGLIHISNISRSRVPHIEDVFTVGDRVCSLVMGVDEGFTNISLSTAELEAEDGDMLRSPDGVYEAAPEQQAYFLQHLAHLQAELAASGSDEDEGEGEGEAAAAAEPALQASASA